MEETVAGIRPLNHEVMERVKDHIDQLTKPTGSLGRIEEVAIQLAGITEKERPTVDSPAIIVAAADHGITAEGVSAYPQELTKLMIENFLRDGAAINVFGHEIGASVSVVDVGVNSEMTHPNLLSKKVRSGTANFLEEDAMTHSEAREAIEVGLEVAEALIHSGHRLLIIGEMGIGNTTASSALLATFLDENVEDLVGRGTGLDEQARVNKINTIETAIARRKPDRNDPIDVVAKVGGLEIAALAGVLLQATRLRIPVLVDGFISSTAAVLAYHLCPTVKDYFILSHQSVEQGHRAVFRCLEKKPLLDLDLRLGEGTGAALAYPLVKASTSMVANMATFADLGIKAKA
ncbi:nicotinate-nucleotide--dimethylbenzimidazole phosphoribosyltransferase [Desertibacillus haloalkaliphilus]|nr:nicotinate-nucleotide--dimethylbenzimidazole phosphoribosyltransferase [Desertibacillus haloalkaliphilus]